MLACPIRIAEQGQRTATSGPVAIAGVEPEKEVSSFAAFPL
jgi:hypothetical protein